MTYEPQAGTIPHRAIAPERQFDLTVSLRDGSAVLFVPGHGEVHLTSGQREQLVEWLSAGRAQ